MKYSSYSGNPMYSPTTDKPVYDCLSKTPPPGRMCEYCAKTPLTFMVSFTGVNGGTDKPFCQEYTGHTFYVHADSGSMGTYTAVRDYMFGGSTGCLWVARDVPGITLGVYSGGSEEPGVTTYLWNVMVWMGFRLEWLWSDEWQSWIQMRTAPVIQVSAITGVAWPGLGDLVVATCFQGEAGWDFRKGNCYVTGLSMTNYNWCGWSEERQE
jgi:hypothetical protein